MYRKENDVARGSAYERGYDRRWSKVRKMKLMESPLCERCQAAGRVVPAVLVHHVDRDPRNNESGNLEALCLACHQDEHKGEVWGGRGDSYQTFSL